MIIQVFLAIIVSLCFLFGSLSFELCTSTLNNWFEKLVPSLFVTTLFIRILHENGFFKEISKRFCSFARPVFNITQEAFSLIISAFLLGAPCNTALINSLCADKKISEEMGRRICTCTCMATPSFIITTCGAVLFKNIKIGMLLWISQILSCLFLLFLTKKTRIEFTEIHKKKQSVFDNLQKNILETWKTLFLIGGYLMATLVTVSVLTCFLNTDFQQFIKCAAEFTYGCSFIASSSMEYKIRILLVCALLSFNGIATWVQVFSLAHSCKPRFFEFAAARLIQMLISCLFIFLTAVQ